jgi:hypothetical protein
VGEPGQAVAGQDAVHCGWWDVEQVADPGGSPAAQDPDLDDSPFAPGRGLAGAVTGSAGSVAHAGFAVTSVALSPACCGGDGDLEAFRSPAQGPVVLDDAAGQAQASGLGQGGVTVGHEGLLGSGADVAIHT